MTEQQWLSSSDPGSMLAWLTGTPGSGPQNATGVLAPTPPPSNRRLRLYACACARLGLSHGVYEGHAAAVRHSLAAAEAAVDGAGPHPLTARGPAAAARAEMEIVFGRRPGLGAALAAALREIVGNPFRPATLCGLSRRPFHNQWAHVDVNGGFWLEDECPACRPLRTHDVLGIARRAYDLRDWGALPVLADALEEAGCENEDITMHLRGREWQPARYGPTPDRTCPHCGSWCRVLGDGSAACGQCYATRRPELVTPGGWAALRGPHVRGCWALDLVLGKE